jgi:hypothetical protein
MTSEPETLRRELSNVIGRQLAGDIQPVLAAIGELSSHENMELLIDRVLIDELWLRDVAGRSYYHANNFVKIVLLAGRDLDWKLRLHLWWPPPEEEAPGKPEDIHSHRWDFTTGLVIGDYVTTEFRVGSGRRHYRYEYGAIGEGSAFTMKPRDHALLTPVFEARLPAGTVYHISHEVLHRVSNSCPQVTATLMIQGPVLCASTEVYSTTPVASDPDGQVRVERIDVPTLTKELCRFRDHL